MSYNQITSIINKTYELLEEKKHVGELVSKVYKDSTGYHKRKKKVCAKGSKWSQSKNSCIKQSPKEKAAKKKSGAKISRALRNLKGSDLVSRNRKTKATMKARKSLVS